MSLSDLRTQFKTETGREELSNSRIDFFINEGIKLLDRMSNYEKGPAIQYVIASQDSDAVDFSTDCLFIREVYLIDSEGARTRLIKTDEDRLLEAKSTGNAGGYYSTRITRPHPHSFDKTVGSYAPYQAYINTLPAYTSTRGILLGEALDKEYLVEIRGKFKSPTLTTDGDNLVTDNWWTVNNPIAVLKAAVYYLYSEYKNMEGMTKYLADIKEVITNLDYDQAEEEAAGVSEMLG